MNLAHHGAEWCGDISFTVEIWDLPNVGKTSASFNLLPGYQNHYCFNGTGKWGKTQFHKSDPDAWSRYP